MEKRGRQRLAIVKRRFPVEPPPDLRPRGLGRCRQFGDGRGEFAAIAQPSFQIKDGGADFRAQLSLGQSAVDRCPAFPVLLGSLIWNGRGGQYG